VIRYAFLVPLLLAACVAPPARAASRIADRERIYKGCAGSEVLRKAADISWKPAESVAARHRDLRARLNLPFADRGDRILLHSFGSHHTTVEFSIVAVRRSNGIWHVDETGEESAGLLETKPKALPHKAYDLSAGDSRRVDALIANPCLLAAPTFLRDPNILAGGARQTLEIITRRRAAVLSWFGLRTREVEELIKLVARD
jgi:hypothetical protein